MLTVPGNMFSQKLLRLQPDLAKVTINKLSNELKILTDSRNEHLILIKLGVINREPTVLEGNHGLVEKFKAFFRIIGALHCDSLPD